MIYAAVQHVEVKEISHKMGIEKFADHISAQAYADLEGGEVFKEHGQNVWYVIKPAPTGLVQVASPLEED